MYETDEERVEALKKWWAENGKFIIAGLVLGIAAIGGWRAWGSYQNRHASEASAKYAQMWDALDAGQTEQARALAETLREDYAGTPYATQAALAMARSAARADKPAEAEKQLKWVIAQGDDDGLKLIARLRLARLQLDAGKPAEAATTLEQAKAGGFAPLFDEVRGDAYAAQGNKDKAREAYQAALDESENGLGNRSVLEMKLHDLAVAGASTASTPDTSAKPEQP
ncbi:MAG: tetratricopeptide repeat protein [Gammaproteobacteria bacterium]